MDELLPLERNGLIYVYETKESKLLTFNIEGLYKRITHSQTELNQIQNQTEYIIKPNS